MDIKMVQVAAASTPSYEVVFINNAPNPHTQQTEVQNTLSLEKERQIEETIDEVIAQASVAPPRRTQYPQYVPAPMPGSSMSVSNNNHHRFFEDLPDNFLENVSPPETVASTSAGIFPTAGQPTLTNLTPVSLIDVSGSTTVSHSHQDPGLTPLIPMAVSTGSPGGGSGHSSTQQVQLVSSPGGHHQYMIGTLKLEPPDPAPSGGAVVSNSGVLSPGSGSTTTDVLNLPPVLVQQNGALHYVKVEVAPDSLSHIVQNNEQVNVNVAGTNSSIRIIHQQPTGGVVSTADLANNMLATISGQSVQQQIVSDPAPTNGSYSSAAGLTRRPNRPRANRSSEGSDGETDDIYIDTKELCKRIAYELKQHSIPQAIFAERVLCRSQGTLSDLLRNPKPWNKLKSGRETFRRMYGWLKQPIQERLTSLELWKVTGVGSTTAASTGATSIPSNNLVSMPVNIQPSAEEPETEVLNSPEGNIDLLSATLNSTLDNVVVPEVKTDWNTSYGPPAPDTSPVDIVVGHRERHGAPDGPKRPRLVFTDIQKRTLQAIFKETQRPSKEMQQTIAEHLGLDLSTVQNFFMNARRRSRLAPPVADGPTPNQQIRAVTPPPHSPPPGHMTFASSGGRSAQKRRPTTGQFNPEHIATIEDTVQQVANTGSEPVTGTRRVVTLDPGAPTPPAIQSTEGYDVYKAEDGEQRLAVNQQQPITTYGRRSLPVMSLQSSKMTDLTSGPPKKRLLLAAQRAARSEVKTETEKEEPEGSRGVTAQIEIN